jgi:hypothetical protein
VATLVPPNFITRTGIVCPQGRASIKSASS